MTITIECKTRTEGSKPKALRREGLIPAALYGHNGAESISLTVKAKEAQLLLKKAAVNNTLVDISIPDISWNGKALIREAQLHPWKSTLYHLSFFSVDAGQTIELVVQISLTGTPAGKKEGGILEQMVNDLNISCLPGNIPDSIDIDVSSYEIGSNLHIRDLVLPEGVSVLDDPDRVIFAVVSPAKGSETSEDGATEGASNA
jgi:large subunit ribosomal protein L25